MKPDPTTQRWHTAILADCEFRLGRPLSSPEREFVVCRSGYVALEMIHDHVKSLAADPAALARYLNSETGASKPTNA